MKPAIVLATLLAVTVPALAQGDWKPYLGTLHDHTSQNGDDGKGNVADALTALKGAGFHFAGISPHNHMVSKESYKAFVGEMAAADEPGKFVSFAAFEWGAISKGGHVGVVGSPDMITAENTDWDGFWRGVDARADALVVLNHPIWGHTYGGIPSESRLQRARLMEVLGGPGEYAGPDYQGRGEFSHREFTISLNDGWRCGVVFGEDNHSGRWGHVNRSRTGVWASALTREGLMEALKSRRTFVSEDPGMTVWIESGSTPMGGEAPAGGGALTVKVTHTGEAVTDVALYVDPDGPGGKVAEEVERFPSGTFTAQVKVTAPGAYAMIVARDASGDLAWSSPIWFGTGTPPRPGVGPQNLVDLNFASPAELDAVDGIGRGAVKALQEARRTGTLFETTAELSKVPGFPADLVAKVVHAFRISTPEQTAEAIAQSLLDEHSLVATAARQTAAHYQAERGVRLLALQVAKLVKASDRARVGKVMAILDASPDRAPAKAEFLKILKDAALEGGWGEALEAALKP